jgi:hypothetical protein
MKDTFTEAKLQEIEAKLHQLDLLANLPGRQEEIRLVRMELCDEVPALVASLRLWNERAHAAVEDGVKLASGINDSALLVMDAGNRLMKGLEEIQAALLIGPVGRETWSEFGERLDRIAAGALKGTKGH